MAQAVAVRQGNGAVAGGHDRPGLASVVVPTHNDGPNIGSLLQRLLAEPCVGEVIVVASGCDDATVPVACGVADGTVVALGGRPVGAGVAGDDRSGMAGRSAGGDGAANAGVSDDGAGGEGVVGDGVAGAAPGNDATGAGMSVDGGSGRPGPGPGPARGRVPVHVFVEPVRSGKAAAVNFGVDRCTQPAIVIVAGDVLPEPGAVGLLVTALAEPYVGMAGGRPVPVNGFSSTADIAVHLLWRVHHRLALRQPKLGEMVALRSEAAVLLPETSVDEACFQARLEGAGWRSRYVPEALIANRGPGTVLDFVKQRRQIHTGHLWLRRREGYTVPSLRPALIVREYWAEIRSGDYLHRPVRLLRTLAAIAMEGWARLLARLDVLRGRETHVWDMVTSAKDPALGSHRVGPRRR